MASELAAMFSTVVLPTLREHYIDRDDPEWEVSFQQQCKQVCSQLGLPQHCWPYITVPAFFSIDHDPRHAWVRQLLSQPRVPVTELLVMQRHTYEDVFSDAIMPQELNSRRVSRGVDVTQLFTNTPWANECRRQVQLDQLLEQYRQEHGRDLWHWAKWQAALYLPEFITLIPWQYMPLCKVAPDIHMPVEHMVFTIKHHVQDEIVNTDLNDQRLWSGAFYQDLVCKAVAKHGNGEAGQHHIAGSVRKQPVACQILAAEKGHELKVKYVFGEDTGCKQRVHRVKGTAGSWIPDTKWT